MAEEIDKKEYTTSVSDSFEKTDENHSYETASLQNTATIVSFSIAIVIKLYRITHKNRLLRM